MALLIAQYSQQDTFYWFLLLAPIALGLILVRLRRYRKKKKETAAWLKGGITRDTD